MKNLAISFVLLSCSGQPFKESESKVEQGNYPTVVSSSGSGDQTEGGVIQSSSGSHDGPPNAGQSSTTSGGGSGAAGSSGSDAMAGGPAMGEGGAGGGRANSKDVAECLANHQTLECARICDSQPTCQGILDCFVRTNSDLTSNCPGFSNEGYSLALEAERNCCNG